MDDKVNATLQLNQMFLHTVIEIGMETFTNLLEMWLYRVIVMEQGPPPNAKENVKTQSTFKAEQIIVEILAWHGD